METARRIAAEIYSRMRDQLSVIIAPFARNGNCYEINKLEMQEALWVRTDTNSSPIMYDTFITTCQAMSVSVCMSI